MELPPCLCWSSNFSAECSSQRTSFPLLQLPWFRWPQQISPSFSPQNGQDFNLMPPSLWMGIHLDIHNSKGRSDKLECFCVVWCGLQLLGPASTLSLQSNWDWFLVSLFIYCFHDFLDCLSWTMKRMTFPSTELHTEGFPLLLHPWGDGGFY